MTLPTSLPTVELINDGYALCHPDDLTLLYGNPRFQEWLHVQTMNIPLNDVIETINIQRVLKRINKRGYYTLNLDNEEATIGQPLLLSLSFSKINWEGHTYVALHVRDKSQLKEKDALIKSHTKMIEKNNRELVRQTRQLEQKNEQLKALSSKLGKYLSPQVYNSIFTGENQVQVETYRKHLTIFFSDIEGFTDLTDSIEPEVLASILNQYLQAMSEIAHKYGGTIDKFIGDGILIFFGDPQSKGQKEDALACVLMALEMKKQMTYLRQRWQDQGIHKKLHIRMGINSGFCTVGNFGSENRLEYTVVGGQVNLASRLETLAEPDEILISYQTQALLGDNIHCESKGEVEVKGLPRPVQTYRVVDYNHEALGQRARELTETFDGFSFSLNLDHADKEKALQALRRLISQLELELLKPKGE